MCYSIAGLEDPQLVFGWPAPTLRYRTCWVRLAICLPGHLVTWLLSFVSNIWAWYKSRFGLSSIVAFCLSSSTTTMQPESLSVSEVSRQSHTQRQSVQHLFLIFILDSSSYAPFRLKNVFYSRPSSCMRLPKQHHLRTCFLSPLYHAASSCK